METENLCVYHENNILLEMKGLPSNSICFIDDNLIEECNDDSRFKNISPQISRMETEITEIQSITFSWRNIVEISGISTLTNLRRLSLDNNNIKVINGLDSLVNLIYLDLSFNFIEQIQGLSSMISLTDLSLFSNCIEEIAIDTFVSSIPGNCIPLEILSLGKNKIKSFECLWSLRRLSHLKSLNLSQNPIIKEPHYRDSVIFILCSSPSLNDQTSSSNFKNGEVVIQVDQLKYLDYCLVSQSEISDIINKKVSLSSIGFRSDLEVVEEREEKESRKMFFSRKVGDDPLPLTSYDFNILFSFYEKNKNKTTKEERDKEYGSFLRPDTFEVLQSFILSFHQFLLTEEKRWKNAHEETDKKIQFLFKNINRLNNDNKSNARKEETMKYEKNFFREEIALQNLMDIEMSSLKESLEKMGSEHIGRIQSISMEITESTEMDNIQTTKSREEYNKRGNETLNIGSQEKLETPKFEERDRNGDKRIENESVKLINGIIEEYLRHLENSILDRNFNRRCELLELVSNDLKIRK